MSCTPPGTLIREVTPRFKEKPRKKPKRTSLRNKADKIFSQLIRARGYCQASHWQDGVRCDGVLQCAHIIGRGNYRLRWDPQNALCLCRGHHVWYTNHPWEWFEQVSYYYPVTWPYLRLEARVPWHKNYEAVFAMLGVGDVKPS